MFGLSFLSPLFLVGMAAAAIPIVIHLLHRRTEPIIEFSAMRFLRRASAKLNELILEITEQSADGRRSDRRLTLELTGAARAWLADRGHDLVYGARPLRRLVAKAIGDELARRLLAGEVGEGDTVVVDAAGGKLSFSRREPLKLG